MSIGTWQIHIVVRRKGNHYASGTASEMPLRSGWYDIEGGNFGYWYGSQVRYRPFQRAVRDAEEYAKKLNEEGE